MCAGDYDSNNLVCSVNVNLHFENYVGFVSLNVRPMGICGMCRPGVVCIFSIVL